MLTYAPLTSSTQKRTHSQTFTWLQPLSAKCQPDKSQGLRGKWNINILTNRAESQESIMLSSPIGDDLISALYCFSLLSIQENMNVDVFCFNIKISLPHFSH